jgi:hypothetical protein
MDNKDILKQLESARQKYLPTNIKTIIIAEAAPDSLERFFYYENVRKADYLFLGIIGVLYPEAKGLYLDNNRNPKMKEVILRQLQSDGFYILDLYELPVSINNDSEGVAVMKLSNKLEKLVSKNTPIILVKATVYDTVYYRLKSKFNIIDKRIDFPGCGNQTKFYEKFSEVIQKLK